MQRLPVLCADHDAIGLNVDGGHFCSHGNRRPGSTGAIVQPSIEDGAIDHQRLRRRCRVHDGMARGREKAGSGERIENRLAREIELLECLGGQHARAVNGLAGHLVFFRDDDVEAVPSEASRDMQASRAAAYNDDVMHAQNLR